MSRTSVIAKRKDKNQIKKAILSGASERELGKRFHVGPKAIRTFKALIKAQLAKAKAEGALKTMDYFKELESLLLHAKRILSTSGKDRRLALAAMDRCIILTRDLGKFSGQLVEAPTTQTNIQINLFEIMPVVRKTLAKFPQALAAVDRAVISSYQERQKKVPA